METPPLRLGDVPFTDRNAAARTFGRAHRHRPYHFSCGSVSQGRRKRLRRRTKTRKGCRKRLRRWTKTRKGCRKRLCRRTNTRKGCRKRLRRRTKTKKVAGRGSADGQKRKTHPKMSISGVGFRLNRLRKWLSWRLDCEILHFFIIFAAEKIKPI